MMNLLVTIKILIIQVFIVVLATVVPLSIGILSVESFFWARESKNETWHNPNTKFDSGLGWAPIPNSDIKPYWGGSIQTNSHGFRSEEIDQSKHQIVILGDSVAWGLGVSNHETAAYYLDQQVAPHGYQVHNLGVSGYGIGQDYLMLERNVDKFDSLKKVILILANNDMSDTDGNTSYGKRKPLFILEEGELKLKNKWIFKYCLRNIFSKSHLLRKYRKYTTNQGEYPAIQRYFMRFAGDIETGGAAQEVAKRLFKKMEALAQSRGAELLVVISTVSTDFDEKYHGLVWFQKHFQSSEYDYIDFYELIKERGVDISKLYISDNVHLSPYGNKFLSELIFEKFHFGESSEEGT